MALALSGRRCGGLAGRINPSSPPSTPSSFSSAAAAAVAVPSSLSPKGGGMGRAAASSAVCLVGVLLGLVLFAVSEEEEEEEERGCMVEEEEEEEEEVEAVVGAGVGMGAVGVLAGFVFSDDEDKDEEEGTVADGVGVGTSATLLSSFPSLASFSSSCCCFKGAARVEVGREGGATGACAFFSTAAGVDATAGVVAGTTGAFLAAAAEVSLEGRGGDALELDVDPAALGTAAVMTWPEMGLVTWLLLPPLFLFFFLPFAMVVVGCVFLWWCGLGVE